MTKVEVPLEKLIGVAVTDRERFKTTVKNIEKALYSDEPFEMPQVPVNEQYIRGKLQDIILHQFGRSQRYLIELVSNSLDSGATMVDVQIQGKKRVVADNGRGMSFDNLAYDLSLPFYSQKQAGTTIGRFGLGFFSTLTELESGGNITVRTRKNGEAYQVTYRKEGNSIYVAFERADAHRMGTEVEIATGSTTASATRVISDDRFGYLFDIVKGASSRAIGNLTRNKKIARFVGNYTKFIPPEKAAIIVNGKQVNRGLRINVPTARTYEVPFEGGYIGVVLNYDARSHIPFRNNGKQLMLSGGILLDGRNSLPYDIVVDYPLSLEIAEGRHALLETDTTAAAKRLVFSRAFLPYLNGVGTVPKRKQDKFDKFLGDLLDLPEAIEFAGSADEDELRELLRLKINVPEGNIPVIRVEGAERILSDYSNISYRQWPHDIHAALYKNPNVKKLSDIIAEKGVDKRRVSELTGEKYQRWLNGINFEDDGDIYFLGLSSRTLSPYGYVNSNTDETRPSGIYVNVNHQLFSQGDYAAKALKWFLYNSVLGARTAENTIVFGNGYKAFFENGKV